MISIFDVKPHEVSRSLVGYTVMFYGEPKVLGIQSVMAIYNALKTWNPEMGIRAEGQI